MSSSRVPNFRNGGLLLVGDVQHNLTISIGPSRTSLEQAFGYIAA